MKSHHQAQGRGSDSSEKWVERNKGPEREREREMQKERRLGRKGENSEDVVDSSEIRYAMCKRNLG